MLNKVVLQGRLVAEPELRRTQSGIATASFRLAVDRDFKDSSGERGADFLPVVCWRGLAETVSKYFRKGQMALVEGRIQTRSYTDRDGRKVYVTEVVAGSVYFCGKKDAAPAAAPAEGSNAEGQSFRETEFSDVGGMDRDFPEGFDRSMEGQRSVDDLVREAREFKQRSEEPYEDDGELPF